MTSKGWRKAGYKTMYRDGRIYLYRPDTGVLIHASMHGGHWMQNDDLNAPPWVQEPQGIDGASPELQRQAENAKAFCYCDSMGGYIETCDFCAGRRSELVRS